MRLSPDLRPPNLDLVCSVLEGKLAEARSKKDTLKARAASAKTSKQIQVWGGGYYRGRGRLLVGGCPIYQAGRARTRQRVAVPRYHAADVQVLLMLYD